MKSIFLLAPGPSLTQEIADQVRGHTTMAIKVAARFAPWADFLFAADWEFFRDSRPLVDTFAGRVLTLSRSARLRLPGKVDLIETSIPGAPVSSGHSAVDVVIGLGFKRIVLVGFDCRLVGGQSHCHADYKRPAQLYSDIHLPAWRDNAARARKAGAEVINATPGSAIDVWPQISLSRVIRNEDESTNAVAEMETGHPVRSRLARIEIGKSDND